MDLRMGRDTREVGGQNAWGVYDLLHEFSASEHQRCALFGSLARGNQILDLSQRPCGGFWEVARMQPPQYPVFYWLQQ